MRRYCYKNTINSFLAVDKDMWIKQMRDSFENNSDLPLGVSQIHAWEDCYDVLKSELQSFAKTHPDFTIVFEYVLPYESGRRPDVILLSSEQVIILEFKMKVIHIYRNIMYSHLSTFCEIMCVCPLISSLVTRLRQPSLSLERICTFFAHFM